MKKIEATIAPCMLDAVRDALLALRIEGMSVSEAKNLRPSAQPGWYRGSQYVVWFAPRYKVELVVPDTRLGDCVDAIRQSTRGTDADGAIIVVLPVHDAIRIRTGDHLPHAA